MLGVAENTGSSHRTGSTTSDQTRSSGRDGNCVIDCKKTLTLDPAATSKRLGNIPVNNGGSTPPSETRPGNSSSGRGARTSSSRHNAINPTTKGERAGIESRRVLFCAARAAAREAEEMLVERASPCLITTVMPFQARMSRGRKREPREPVNRNVGPSRVSMAELRYDQHGLGGKSGRC